MNHDDKTFKSGKYRALKDVAIFMKEISCGPRDIEEYLKEYMDDLDELGVNEVSPTPDLKESDSFLVIPQVASMTEEAYQVEGITIGLREASDEGEVNIYDLRNGKFYLRKGHSAWSIVNTK